MQHYKNLAGLTAAQPQRKLKVFRRDRHPSRVDRTQVRVLEETHKVRLRRLLQSTNRSRLETQIPAQALRNLPHKSLERKPPDQKISAALVFADLPQSNSTRTVPLALLHSTSNRNTLPSNRLRSRHPEEILPF